MSENATPMETAFRIIAEHLRPGADIDAVQNAIGWLYLQGCQTGEMVALNRTKNIIERDLEMVAHNGVG